MKKLLVTGAGGFIGSHLTESLVRKGYSVKAFLHYNSMNRWGWLEKSPFINDIEIIIGDIRDFDSVKNAMTGCDTVFHLAALIGIPYSYVSPKAYIETNITGTYNVLEAARGNDFENILITSTSETYGSAQYVPIDERHPMVGQSPYSATKIAADQLAIAYHTSFNLPVKIVRPFNTFGPRQSARAIIPTVVSQVAGGSKSICVGSLTPTRDLTYVMDTVEGFFQIAQSSMLFGEITNIGSNFEISVEELILKISVLMNSPLEIISEEERIRPEKSEVKRLLCDNSKIINHTNWKPLFSLEDGLVATIEWVRDNLAIYKQSYTI